jgi:hypothetical protein
LKRLPKEDFEKHTKAVPFGSITNTVRVAGEQSPFHINATDPATFLFKVFKDEDAGGARLYQVTVKAAQREFETGKWKRSDFKPNSGLSVIVSK